MFTIVFTSPECGSLSVFSLCGCACVCLFFFIHVNTKHKHDTTPSKPPSPPPCAFADCINGVCNNSDAIVETAAAAATTTTTHTTTDRPTTWQWGAARDATFC